MTNPPEIRQMTATRGGHALPKAGYMGITRDGYVLGY